MRFVVFAILLITLLLTLFYLKPWATVEQDRSESDSQPVLLPKVVSLEFPHKDQKIVEDSLPAGVESSDLCSDEQWRQQHFKKFAGQLRTHFNAYPLSNSADFWLVRSAFEKNDLNAVMVHLNSFFSRAQPVHLRFAASYISLLIGVFNWLKTSDEQEISSSVFSVITVKDMSRIKQLQQKYSFIPGTGFTTSKETNFTDNRKLLLHQLMCSLNLAFSSQDDLIKQLYDYTIISEQRCIHIRSSDSNSADENMQNFYPDVSQYDRLRYQVRESPEAQAEADSKKWFDDFSGHWTKSNIPFCLHGGRLHKIGNAWLCKYHGSSYVATGIGSDSLRLSEMIAQYVICHPEIEIETISDWLDFE